VLHYLSDPKRQKAVATARKAGVLPALELARFLGATLHTTRDNALFLHENPSFLPPPLWWMHDMYAHVSYRLYHETGIATAAALSEVIDRHLDGAGQRVADWGCGLGRVARHLPGRFAVKGFDYNPDAIRWCKRSINGVEFALNGLEPPLPAADESFDVLYSLSVFTHLSARAHEMWIAEIARVLAPGGLFIGAFHMSPRPEQLFAAERAIFEAGELVVRGGVKEGGRIFTAFHPEPYLRRLLSHFVIVDGPREFFGQTLIAARKPRP